MQTELTKETPRVHSGVHGLDDILGGGLTPNRLYLIEGDPGSGKTTLALQFLLEGSRNGELGLYVTLSETKEELLSVGASHGWSVDKLNIFELASGGEALAPEAQYTMFHPSEVESTETMKRILAEVDRIGATRIVFDSLSEIRLLAQNSLRYRRQILSLKQFFAARDCTVLLLDDRTSEDSDLQLRSIAHGVIVLDQLAPEYGSERRRLRILKLRGQKYRGGYHDFIIARGGLRIFPRLIAAEHIVSIAREHVPSGLKQLDALMGGGLGRGTSTLLQGPAGTGKSSVAIQYAVAAAQRGEKAAVFIFDESVNTLEARSEGLNIGLRRYLDDKTITIQQVDPAELSPGEFVDTVRRSVEVDRARIIVIDSLNGYLHAMPDERFLVIQLHELLTYVGQQGANTILVVAQSGLVGSITTPVEVSYLADNVLLFRYFEHSAELRVAISVMKKRSGEHERTIREIRMSKNGIELSEPLKIFSGILGGAPVVDERKKDL